MRSLRDFIVGWPSLSPIDCASWLWDIDRRGGGEADAIDEGAFEDIFMGTPIRRDA
jgi:hypothetical protein